MSSLSEGGGPENRPIERIIREKNGNQPSVHDQVAVALILDEEDVVSQENALKQDEISTLLGKHNVDLDYKLRTSLDNLYSISVIARFFPPGSKYVPISERLDQIIFGEVEATVRTDLEALLAHLHDDDSRDNDRLAIVANGREQTIRQVIAKAAEIPPDTVERYLRGGDSRTQRRRLNAAIDAIVDAEGVNKRDSYGKVVFRHKAYRYYLL